MQQTNPCNDGEQKKTLPKTIKKRETEIQTVEEDKHTDGEQLQTYINCSNYKVSVYSEKRVKKIESTHTDATNKHTDGEQLQTYIH